MTAEAIHLGQPLDPATLDALADFICGDDHARYPTYRSSSYLSRFFQSVGIDEVHDGTTRKWWVLSVLQNLQPAQLEAVVQRLADPREYKGDQATLGVAVRSLNSILSLDGFKVDFDGSRPELRRGPPVVLDADKLSTVGLPPDEAEFLGRQFGENVDLTDLGLDSVVAAVLQARVDEAQACPRDRVALGTIFLLGSTLEGLLLAYAVKHPAKFMSARSAPKDKLSKAKKVHEWKLSELIDASHEIGLLGLDVKKFSHALRDFRNYIHPWEQMSSGFHPDQHTVDICWQVFKASVAQLKASGL